MLTSRTDYLAQLKFFFVSLIYIIFQKWCAIIILIKQLEFKYKLVVGPIVKFDNQFFNLDITYIYKKNLKEEIKEER